MSNCPSRNSDFLGCTVPPDPALIVDGWELRFIADARMAQEAVRNYGELGFEVKLEPIEVNTLRDECSACKSMLEQFRAVYTRKRTA